MNDILLAIARAGRDAANRPDLLAAFFKLGEIDGTLGDYRIDAHGDTSLTRFDGYRVGPGGGLVLAAPIG